MGDDDDEAWEGSVGKDNSEPRETRRGGSVGLRNSSQTVLNRKGRSVNGR